MTSVFEVVDFGSFLSFWMWVLCTAGLAKAVFGSFFSAELNARWQTKDAPRRHKVEKLKWVVEHRMVWSPEAVRDPRRGQNIDEEGMRKAVEELTLLTKTSFWWRMLQYLLGCWACQTFWASVLVWLSTNWVRGGFVPLFFSCLAYSSGCVLLMFAFTRGSARIETARTRGPRRSGGCKGPGCGG